MAKQSKLNTLWFVKYEHHVRCEPIVFNFTLPIDATVETAFEHGRSFINPAYVGEFKNVSAEPVCRTADTVLCFEPC